MNLFTSPIRELEEELLVRRRVKGCSAMRGAVPAERAVNVIQCVMKVNESRARKLMLIYAVTGSPFWAFNQSRAAL